MDGGAAPGQAESALQTALRSKFPTHALRPAPARTPAAYPILSFMKEEVQAVDGAFGPRMPKMKAAGLDGYRLEHIAYLVLLTDRAAAGFARFVSWLTADHVARGSTGPSERFMARLGSCQVFPFRKKVNSADPRPVTPPSALDRAVERMIDIKLRVEITKAGGPRQFSYNASAGADQVTQLVRIFQQLRVRCVTYFYDTKNAYSSCSNAAVLEALEAVPAGTAMPHPLRAAHAEHRVLRQGARSGCEADDEAGQDGRAGPG